MNQLSCLWEGNHTLSGFWEVHGVRAHCLLDRRCKGVMASSNFAQATGMAMFQLDQPVSLQLACIGSKSMINYSEQQNRSHVWKFGIVHLIEAKMKFVKSYKYSDMCSNISAI